MKYIFPFVVILFLGFSSCKKDEVEQEILYDVYYKEYNETYSQNVGQIEFDLNNDGNEDCYFSNYYYIQSYDSMNLGKIVSDVVDKKYFGGSDSLCEVALYSDTTIKSLFGVGESLNGIFNWVKSERISKIIYTKHYGGNVTIYESDLPFKETEGKGFLAIRLIIGNNYYFGWVHIGVNNYEFTIYSSAINRIPNVPIRIGQTRNY